MEIRHFEYFTDHLSIYMVLDRNIALSFFTCKLPVSQSTCRCR